MSLIFLLGDLRCFSDIKFVRIDDLQNISRYSVEIHVSGWHSVFTYQFYIKLLIKNLGFVMRN